MLWAEAAETNNKIEMQQAAADAIVVMAFRRQRVFMARTS
jgi:hypothetical protein